MKWHPFETGREVVPGFVAYRFSASLYYANANRFAQELRELVEATPAPRWVCLDASAIADIDYSGAETFRELDAELEKNGIRLVFADVMDVVRGEAVLFGITDVLPADAYYDTVELALEAYQREAR